MDQADWQNGERGPSLMDAATTVLRGRRRILMWMFGSVLMIVPVALSKPALYKASASFAPQVSDGTRAGLSSLAGQFGLMLPASGQSQSLDFYVRLLNSRDLLSPIVRDTFVVRELGGKRMLLLDLFEIKAPSPEARDEKGVEQLSKAISVKAVKMAEVIELSVLTRWPSVSLAIASSLVRGIVDFNQRTRQGQAGAERRFIQGRIEIARMTLRSAEDRLETFLKTNRNFASAPQLVFERDRIQRDVVLQQQLFASLTQAYEDARIREVRDTPVITVAEVPAVRSLPEARGRVKLALLALALGGVVGSLLEFARVSLARLREREDGEFNTLLVLFGDVRDDMRRPLNWIKRRSVR